MSQLRCAVCGAWSPDCEWKDIEIEVQDCECETHIGRKCPACGAEHDAIVEAPLEERK